MYTNHTQLQCDLALIDTICPCEALSPPASTASTNQFACRRKIIFVRNHADSQSADLASRQAKLRLYEMTLASAYLLLSPLYFLTYKWESSSAARSSSRCSLKHFSRGENIAFGTIFHRQKKLSTITSSSSTEQQSLKHFFSHFSAALSPSACRNDTAMPRAEQLCIRTYEQPATIFIVKLQLKTQAEVVFYKLCSVNNPDSCLPDVLSTRLQRWEVPLLNPTQNLLQRPEIGSFY